MEPDSRSGPACMALSPLSLCPAGRRGAQIREGFYVESHRETFLF